MLGTPDLSKDLNANAVRTCAACQQPAVRVFHVTHHYYKGIPAGRSYQHRCHGCGAEFETMSTWRVVVEVLSAMLMVPMGLFMAGIGVANLSESWWVSLIGLVLLLAGGWIGWTALRSILSASKNPRA